MVASFSTTTHLRNSPRYWQQQASPPSFRQHGHGVHVEHLVETRPGPEKSWENAKEMTTENQKKNMKILLGKGEKCVCRVGLYYK